MEATNVDEINVNLSNHEIPLVVNLVSSDHIEGLGDIDGCDPYISDDTIYYLLKNKILDDNIGYIGIDISEECIYISYICILKKYRSVSLSAFLAYIAIFLGIKNKKKYIFSVGVSDVTVDAPYERYFGNVWVLSQGILVNKFGFRDLYQGKLVGMYNPDAGEGRLIKETCGSYAETYLDLKGDISKYEEYHSEFASDPKSRIFKKYIDFVSTLPKLGSKKKSKSRKKRSKRSKSRKKRSKRKSKGRKRR